jgi:fatty acid-binding protein DegV
MAAENDVDWHHETIIVAHGGAPEDGEAFAAQVRERFAPKEVLVLTIGAAIGTYAAEGAILLSF